MAICFYDSKGNMESARSVPRAGSTTNATPVLCSLHWLPFASLINCTSSTPHFQIHPWPDSSTSKVLYIARYTLSARRVRSSSKVLFVPPTVAAQSSGHRAFQCSCGIFCSDKLRQTEFVAYFQKLLKNASILNLSS